MVTRKRKGLEGPRREDALPIIERIICGAEYAGDTLVELNIHFARLLLDLAKQAPAAANRPYIPARKKLARKMKICNEVDRRKRALMAEGITKGKARMRAAEEVAHSPELNSDNLSARTIERMAQARR